MAKLFHVSFAVLALLFSDVLCQKRRVDQAKRGGAKRAGCARLRGIVPNCVRAGDLLLSADSNLADEDGYVLLEEESGNMEQPSSVPKAPIPDAYDFMVDFLGDEGNCVKALGHGDQGSCNTCWAFALAKVMTHRMCRATQLRDKYAAKEDKLVVPDFSMNPIVMTCGAKNFMKVNMCEPQDLLAAISVAQTLPQGEPHSARLTMSYQNIEFDPAKLDAVDCDKVLAGMHESQKMYDTRWAQQTAPLAKIVRSRRAAFAVKSAKAMMREIMEFGPIVIYMRLTAEFSAFRGSFFTADPKKLTYLTYVDSETKKREKSLHFVGLHGWGSLIKDEKTYYYWLVENSWGDIYDIADLDPTKYIYGAEDKTSFVKIDDDISGPDDLGMVDTPEHVGLSLRMIDVYDGKRFVPLTYNWESKSKPYNVAINGIRVSDDEIIREGPELEK